MLSLTLPRLPLGTSLPSSKPTALPRVLVPQEGAKATWPLL